MQKEELKTLFDQQAAGYDQQWAKMSPIRDGLFFLLRSIFADLPAEVRMLCVGAGTGVELSFLANNYPNWKFTVVEPSGAMLEKCRQRAEAEGFAARCKFHEGYLETLTTESLHQAATCFLVSQFLLVEEERIQFFREIANRLQRDGILASSDLASDAASETYGALLHVWMKLMSTAGVTPEVVERARAAYAKDVAILPPAAVASLLSSAGFSAPVQFYQAGLLHAWFAKRAANATD